MYENQCACKYHSEVIELQKKSSNTIAIAKKNIAIGKILQSSVDSSIKKSQVEPSGLHKVISKLYAVFDANIFKGPFFSRFGDLNRSPIEGAFSGSLGNLFRSFWGLLLVALGP